MNNKIGWWGFDLDGTLAQSTGGRRFNYNDIGNPIPEIVKLARDHIENGDDVRIFTARVGQGTEEEVQEATKAIEDWCEIHLGKRIPVTCKKDYNLIAFYDDRAIQVAKNRGILLIDVLKQLEES